MCSDSVVDSLFSEQQIFDDGNHLLDTYESQRSTLPGATFPPSYERCTDLEALTYRYDAFFFDAFGVLNVGDTAIEGAAKRVAAVRKAGRHVRIVSNAASVPLPLLHAKYQRLGFDFAPDEIISSRLTLIHHLKTEAARHWGVAAPAGADISDLGVEATNLAEYPDAFDRVEGFIVLTTTAWTHAQQQQLEEALQTRPRPVLLANPDLAAPRETGFSVEPGEIGRRLRQHANVAPQAFGKPFPLIFDIAVNSLPGAPLRRRVLMIGDTLHTDVLGGSSAGLSTALVTAYGASSGLDWDKAIRDTGIVPHHVLDHI